MDTEPTPTELKRHEEEQRRIKLGLASDALMDTNVLLRVYNLIRDRLSKVYGEARIKHDTATLSDCIERTRIIKLVSRRLLLANQASLFRASEKDEEDSAALGHELQRLGFDERQFIEVAVKKQLVTKQEIEWIMDGLDVDGSPLRLVNGGGR